MAHHAAIVSGNRNTLPQQPSWVTSPLGEGYQNVAFLSGVRFTVFDMTLRQGEEAVPMTLLANTLALKAAVATSKLEGRMSCEADIRDAYFLTAPGEALGPDGDMFAFWRNAARVRFAVGQLSSSHEELISPSVSEALQTILTDAAELAKKDGPVAAAVYALAEVIAIDDRAEKSSCLVSDMVLASFFGWSKVKPLSALHLTKADLLDLRSHEESARLKIEAAISRSAETGHMIASKLARQAYALRSIAPKLRAKGSDDAVKVFLSENAVAPSGMLSPAIKGTGTTMTGRAARRLCDRLVELGVVKELTGRSTFRLYGFAP